MAADPASDEGREEALSFAYGDGPMESAALATGDQVKEVKLTLYVDDRFEVVPTTKITLCHEGFDVI